MLPTEQARLRVLPALPCTTPVPAVIDKAVSKGVLHLNTVSRKISRLSKRVKALSQG